MRSSQGIAGRSARVPHATVEVQTYVTWRGWVITRHQSSSGGARGGRPPRSQQSRQDDQTLAEVGEFGLIGALSAWLPAGPRTLVGIGDDAAVLAVPDGRVVATTDFLIEGRHFRRDWSGAADVGHKAAARSLADCAAMGAEPAALPLALAAPPA